MLVSRLSESFVKVSHFERWDYREVKSGRLDLHVHFLPPFAGHELLQNQPRNCSDLQCGKLFIICSRLCTAIFCSSFLWGFLHIPCILVACFSPDRFFIPWVQILCVLGFFFFQHPIVCLPMAIRETNAELFSFETQVFLFFFHSCRSCSLLVKSVGFLRNASSKNNWTSPVPTVAEVPVSSWRQHLTI